MTNAVYEERPTDASAARELGRALELSPTVAQILLQRGLTSVEAAREFIEPRLAGLTDPSAMRGRDEAADRLVRAIERRERIVVFGDYDVDGTTATTILAGMLERLGGDVRVIAANRFVGGYGFSEPALGLVRDAGCDVLVTCDCGSSDHPRIEAAMKGGIDVVVVDHHLVPKEPLPALAFLNPHQPGCGFPYKELASAGLVFFLGAAIRARLAPSLDVREFLDLVALGTVADVVPLDGDNRRLVRAGLQRLSSASARPGVRALREVARVKGGVQGQDIAFRLAPRLNAAGRLADAALTLELLRATTMEDARRIAARVEEINGERRAIQEENTEEAARAVRALYLDGAGEGARVEGGIVVASRGWHRGVVGIVAARLTELFDAPAIVIAIEGDTGHGSGRTVGGFPLHDAVSASSRALLGFGGHQAALGVRVEAGSVDAFRADFDHACRGLRAAGYGPRVKHVDVCLDGERFPIPSARDLAAIEPTGAGNPEPRFSLEGALVEASSVVGAGHLKLRLRVGDERLSAFGYGLGDARPAAGSRVHVVGSLRPDTWHGDGSVELRLEGFR